MKRFQIKGYSFLVVATLVTMVNCSKSKTPATEQVQLEVKDRPRVTSLERLKAIQSINTFSCDIYRLLADDKQVRDQNLFLSPYSTYLSLGMAYVGARGNTALQIKNGLGLQISDDKLHAAVGELIEELDRGTEQDTSFQFILANGLWGQRGQKLLPDFLAINTRDYKIEFGQLDFLKDPRGSCEIINSWVRKKTQSQIKELLNSSDINSNTRLVITNGVYFTGRWEQTFDKSQTKTAAFKTGPGEALKVATMFQKNSFNYAKSRGVQLLEMKYKGDRFSLFVLLPDKIDGLSELDKLLTSEYLDDLLSKRGVRRVKVFLPRFEFSFGSDLVITLAKLGIAEAFQSGKADFSGINGIKPPNRDSLYFNRVIHKTSVTVDEQGTKAAAATAILVKDWAVPGKNETAVLFNADHPFIFLIRHNLTGVILFLGRVINPA